MSRFEPQKKKFQVRTTSVAPFDPKNERCLASAFMDVTQNDMIWHDLQKKFPADRCLSRRLRKSAWSFGD